MKNSDVVFAIQNLPPFPETAIRAIQIAQDSQSSAQDMVNVIQYDQSITANILRVVNSASFALRQKVTSLQQAVAYLGSTVIMELLLFSGTLTYYSNYFTGYDQTGIQLWQHSVVSGTSSKALGEMIEPQKSSTYFTVGLLHDIGKVVLQSFVKDKYDEILRLVEREEYSFVQAEREVLGMDHAQVGGEVALKWGLPQEMARPISLHHSPEDALFNDFLSPVVFIADRLGHLVTGSVGADRWSFRRIKDALVRVHLDFKDLDSVIFTVEKTRRQIKSMLQQ